MVISQYAQTNRNERRNECGEKMEMSFQDGVAGKMRRVRYGSMSSLQRFIVDAMDKLCGKQAHGEGPADSSGTLLTDPTIACWKGAWLESFEHAGRGSVLAPSICGCENQMADASCNTHSSFMTIRPAKVTSHLSLVATEGNGGGRVVPRTSRGS